MITLTSEFFQIINGNSSNSIVDNEISEAIQDEHIKLTSETIVISDVMAVVFHQLNILRVVIFQPFALSQDPS